MKMNKLDITFLFFIFAINFSSLKAEVTSPCLAKMKIMDFKSLDLEKCNLAGALVNTPEVRDYHREKIYKKLSQDLARQIDQSVEEFAILDEFYGNNGNGLGDNPNVKQNCSLNVLESYENKCPGKKLDFLKDALNAKGSSLKRHFISKFNNLSSSKKYGENQCPIEDASGVFKLKSKLDNESAQDFINLLKKKDIDPNLYQSFINQYPQFKLIQQTKNTDFINSFESYVKSFNGNKSASEYIADFFKIKSNNDILGNGLGDQCKTINDNAQKFLCTDLEELSTENQKISVNLFNLDTEKVIKNNDWDLPEVGSEAGDSFYAAYGFLCLERSNKKNSTKNKKSEKPLDDWYLSFNQNTRPDNKNIESEREFFCKVYNCKDIVKGDTDKVMEVPSCKSGGPIKSVDILAKYCKNKLSSCASEQEKNYLFIKSIEDAVEKNKEADAYEQRRRERGTNPNSNEPEAERPRRLSTFAENFLGVEGSLIAEGKKVTPATIAEKTEEFKERNLDPSPAVASETKPTQLAKNEQPAAAPVVPVATSLAPEVNDGKNINIKTAQLAQEQDSIAPVKRSRRSSNTSSSSSTYRSDDSSSSSSQSNNNDDEIKKMRAEMEDLAKSMKAPSVDAQNIAAIADSNARYVSKAKTTISGSSASEERERNLNSWESRLREREGDLFDRETRTPSSFSESGNTFKKSEASENSAKASKTNDGAIQLSSSDKEKDKKSGSGGASKSDGKGSATGTDSAETVISSEELANMKADSLAKLGLGADRTFIMKIKHLQKFYNVTVKKLFYQDKEMLVPLLNESNSSLAKIILDSPLFSEYKKIQFSSRLSNK